MDIKLGKKKPKKGFKLFPWVGVGAMLGSGYLLYRLLSKKNELLKTAAKMPSVKTVAEGLKPLMWTIYNLLRGKSAEKYIQLLGKAFRRYRIPKDILNIFALIDKPGGLKKILQKMKLKPWERKELEKAVRYFLGRFTDLTKAAPKARKAKKVVGVATKRISKRLDKMIQKLRKATGKVKPTVRTITKKTKATRRARKALRQVRKEVRKGLPLLPFALGVGAGAGGYALLREKKR